ncbi:hypothetical protein [Streptomyces pseudogriseolus]|uniref:hypothetical protein n=1 Tax=Streptomyces pseudogriseolus TaxID=36817 RepID=UPI003FA1C154
MAVFRAARGRQIVALHRVAESHRVAGTAGDLAGQEESLRFLWLSMQRGGFAELILDETSQFRREHHGMAVDRQVGVLVVAVELVCGQFDDPREGEGVETDEGAGDAHLQGERNVVEASA